MNYNLEGPGYWYTDNYPSLDAQRVAIQGEDDLEK